MQIIGGFAIKQEIKMHKLIIIIIIIIIIYLYEQYMTSKETSTIRLIQ